mmetsp:Transcript_57598/g.132286  ORF Transcript_57598/g.132286 Transcript_57598/m.132286 type:complete len:143 (-) Transcript_57598:529-957(-)|eukprot:CAMPEP_0119373686 /NCGR_PEP_ID=MMETSP1334-20130426/27069_1 /TAXON_ID=127549 /ORGANISM="Calcidiscus leptoporus, Strain RCC1130" /LENGTH=142 /DNA_ID=CAMNT_0007391539 /DNA_START=82 /DNA_END=510 /DNA_ORIENTATION=-
MSQEVIVVPRNFKLLDELEKTEKGQTDMSISYGLIDSGDVYMSDWQCSIIAPMNTSLENRIISLTVHCDMHYPASPPSCRFVTKLDFPFLDAAGNVRTGTVKWDPKAGTIENFLKSLRILMAKPEYRSRKHPAEGTTFSRAA